MRHTVSERRKKWFFLRSMVRAFWEHLDKHRKPRQPKVVSRPLFAEALEPRVLFSATPAPVEPEQDEVPVAQEAPEAQEGQVAGSTGLSQEDLDEIVAAARQRWIDSGISAEQLAALDSVTYTISDLGGNKLGKANGFTITIDDDAAGTDAWFVDTTPSVDEEFSATGDALAGGGASDRFDLLSAILHEQGHLLGLGEAPAGGDDVMGNTIAVGERRLPDAGQADGAVASSIVGDHFLGGQGVFANVAEAAGYQLVYTLPIGIDDNLHASVPYTVNNSASIADGSFDRIAYYLELDNGSGLQWVFVSADAFTTITSEIGVPSFAGSNKSFQEILSNMNVASNVPGIVTGTGISTGNIEFWPYDYGVHNVAGIPNATTSYDFGDQSALAGQFGSMQIHNHDVDGTGPGTVGQTIFALNRFNATGTAHDIGIGTSPGTFPDWTAQANAGTYIVKNLQILVGNAAPPTTTEVTVNGTTGDLEITDTNGGDTDDDITIVVTGGGTNYHITDATSGIDVTQSIAGVTGDEIIIEGTGGDDTLTLDLSGGTFTQDIVFNGGSGNDKLVVTGGTFGTVTYNATDATDGVLDFGGFTVTFTGLEPIDMTGSVVGDYIINVDPGHSVAGGHTTTIEQISGTDTRVSITGGFENVLFRSLTGTLTINGEDGENDIITVTGVGTSFVGGLTINGGTGDDTVNLNGDITFAAGKSLSITAESVVTAAGVDLATSGAGTVTLAADDVALSATSTITSASAVTLVQQTVGRQIDLGTETAGQLSLTDSELDRITAGAIQIGDANSGAITVSALISRPAATNVSLTTGSNQNITFSGAGSIDSNNGNVTLTTSGTGAITSGGATTDVNAGTGAISLVAGSNGIGASGNPFTFSGATLATATTGNGEQVLNGTATIGAAGLDAGSGRIILGGGTLTLGGDNRINNATDLTLRNGATFAMGAFSETIDELTLNDGNVTGTGTLTSGTTLDLRSGSIGANLAGAVGVSKTTAGTVTLTGTNVYTGATNINSGILDVDGTHTGGGTFDIAALATLRGSGSITANISGAPGSFILSDGNLTLGNSADSSGFVTNGTLTVGMGHVVTVNDSGAALLGISTVVNGTLQRPSSSGIFSLESGDVLSGSGSVTGVIDTNSGSISPGTAGTAVLSESGNLNLSNGTLVAQINGNIPGTQHDQVSVAGTVNITNANLAVSGTVASSGGQVIVLIENDGTDAVTGTFNRLNGVATTLSEGSTVVVNGVTFYLSYVGGTGNDVTLTQAGPAAINADGAGAGAIIVRKVGGNLVTYDDGAIIDSRPFASVTGQTLTINGTAGNNETLTVDYATGDFFDVNLIWNGGAGGDDGLIVLGTGAEVINYTPSSTTNGNGVLTVGSNTITFTGLEPIDVVGAASFTLTLPLGNDSVIVANATTTLGDDALRLSGTSGALPFEYANVRNVGTVIIDTTFSDGGDTIIVLSANNTHGNTNLQILTGNSGTDSVTVSGTATFTGDVLIQTGTINLTGGTLTAANATFRPQSGATVGIGGGAGTFNLDDAELTGSLNVSGTVTIGATNAGDVTINALDVSTETYHLEILSGTQITQSGSLMAPKNVTIRANQGNSGAHDFDMNIGAALSTIGGDILIEVGTAAAGSTTTLRQLTASGNVTVTTGGLSAIQYGAVGVGIMAGGTVSLTSAKTGTSAITGNGTISAGGDVTLQAAGDIAVNAAISSTMGKVDVVSTSGTVLTAAAGDIMASTSSLFSGGTAVTLSGDVVVAAAGGVVVNSAGAITLNAAVDAGSGLIDVNANNDGSGAGNLTVAETASLTTTNATGSAIDLRVNTGAGGTGGLNLGGSLTTGTGGGVSVSTETFNALAGTLVVNNTTINTGTGGTVTITADDELWIGPGSAKTLTMTGGALVLNANADGGAASNQDRFYMFDGSAIAGTASSVIVNITNSQSNSRLWSIGAASGAAITVNQTGSGGFDHAGGTVGAAGSGAVTYNAAGAITIGGTINAGSGLIDINANNDGSGAQSLTVGETAVLTTTDATPGAIDLRVNTALGGTGGLNLGGSLTTGTGGGVSVSTETFNALAGTLVVNNTTINTGTGGTVTITADDELWIGPGSAKTLTMTGGALVLNVNADGGASANQDRFYMFDGSAIAGTASSVIININNSQSGSRLWSIGAASGAAITVNQTGSGSFDQAGGTVGSAGAGNVTYDATGGIAINGTIDAGSGLIDINANNDGSGAQSLTNGESAVLITTNATANAIDLRVNTLAGGTGSFTLGGSLTTGAGGGVVVSDDTLNTATTSSVINNTTINTGAGGSATITGDDEVRIGNGGPAKTLTITAGALTINANTDGTGADRFYMFDGAAIAGNASALNINVGSSSGNSRLWSIAAANGVDIEVDFNGTGAIVHDGGTIGSANAGTVVIDSEGGVTINGTINAGGSLIDVNANSDGAGGQNLILGETAVLSTTNATATAIDLKVNTLVGGTGSFTLGGSLTTGAGGGVVVSDDTLNTDTTTSVINNTTVDTGTGGTLTIIGDDEVRIGTGGPAKTLTITAGALTINANTDGTGADRFYMFNGAAVAGNASALNINVGSSSGISEVRSLAAATDVDINVNFDGTGTLRHSGGTIAATGTADVNIQSTGGVDLLGTISVANGVVNVDANNNGLGGQSLGVGETAVITTANTGANAIDLRVNTDGGGTGSLSLGGSLTTGAGGTITANNSTPDLAAVAVNINNVTFNTGVGGTTNLTASDEFFVQTNKTLSVTGGVLNINANADALGAERFYMFGGSAINSTGTTSDAVSINVGASSGTSEYRDIAVGNGGGITVTSDANQNLTHAGTTMTATNGTIDLVVRNLNLAGNLSAVGGTATIRRSSVGTIGVFNATAFGDLQIDQGELSRISAGTLNIGGATSGTNNATLIRVNGVSTTAGVTGLTRFTAIESTGSDVQFLGANSFNSIEVNANNQIDVQAAASIGVQTGNATFNADLDDSGAGNFQSAAGASINSSAGNGDVTINAADFSLAVGSSISSGSGDISFLPTSTGRTVELGGSGLGLNVTLTDAELDTLTSTGIVYVGDSSTGNITISDAVTPAGAPNFVLTTPGTVLDASGAVSDFTGSSLVIDGDFQSGTTPAFGVLNVTGSFTFASNNTFTVDLQGNATPVAGTHYDQVNVTPSGPASAITIGSDVILNLILSGTKPPAGSTYTLVNNGTTNAVTGRFVDAQTNTILDEGDWIDQDLVLYRISYVGGDGNDVVLTSYGPVETAATLDVNGNLLISDIETTTTNDTLTFTVVGNNLRINDPNEIVGFDFASPNGSVRIDEHTIEIPLAAFNGLIVNTGDGNDSVTFADFNDTSTFSNFLLVNGGDGIDTINFNADFSGNAGIHGVTDGTAPESPANRAVELRADTINVGVNVDIETSAVNGTINLVADRNLLMDTGSRIETVDGAINLEANAAGLGSGQYNGMRLKTATLESSSGDVSLTGRGGNTLSFNYGVNLETTTVNTDGVVTIVGTGGGDGSAAAQTGVLVNYGSSIDAAAISITGQGGNANATGNAGGIYIGSSSTLTVSTGDLTLTGTGATNAGTANTGVFVGASTLTSTGGTNILINGTGNGGSGNEGVEINSTVVTTTGAGTVTIRGTGATGASSNVGVLIAGASQPSQITTVNGEIRIEGTSNGTLAGNHGVSISSGSQVSVSGSGNLVVSGTGGAATNSGSGVLLSSASLSVNTGGLEITGTGRAMAAGRGVETIGSTITSGGIGNITMVGSANAAATGGSNSGISIHSTQINLNDATGVANLVLQGTGGGGTTLNHGVVITTGSALASVAGDAEITGQAGGSGGNAAGVSVANSSTVTIGGNGNLTVTGTGSGSGSGTTTQNRGVQISSSTLSVTNGLLTLTGAGGGAGNGTVNHGIDITGSTSNRGTVRATGSGSLLLSGTGAKGGIGLNGSFAEIATASGDIQIIGSGGTGVSNTRGIFLANSILTSSSGGDISLDGTADSMTTGTGNVGVWIISTSLGSSGAFDIEGTGGGGTGTNHGIYMQSITNVGGAITTTGTAGGGATSLAKAGNFFP